MTRLRRRTTSSSSGIAGPRPVTSRIKARAPRTDRPATAGASSGQSFSGARLSSIACETDGRAIPDVRAVSITLPATIRSYPQVGDRSRSNRSQSLKLARGRQRSFARTELVKSRKKLERKLDHRVPWLAYPYGDYDGRIETLAKKAGYKLAVTTGWGSLQSASRPFALKRLRVLNTTGVSGLAAMLGG